MPLCGLAQSADLPLGSALLDGNGGLRVAVARRLHKTYKTYKTYKIMVGRHVIPRGFACAAVWVGSGQIYRRGVQGFFMATAVCSLRGRDA